MPEPSMSYIGKGLALEATTSSSRVHNRQKLSDSKNDHSSFRNRWPTAVRLFVLTAAARSIPNDISIIRTARRKGYRDLAVATGASMLMKLGKSEFLPLVAGRTTALLLNFDANDTYTIPKHLHQYLEEFV